MEISEGSFGTVLAALIAAAISLVGLLISKDQKTTEFRQAWIDRLRDDVAEFLSYHSLMSFQIRLKDPERKNEADFQRETFDSMRGEILKMERVHAAILLRLNPKEHSHIVSKLEEIKSFYGEEVILSSSLMQKHEDELLAMFQKELKKEWSRVKSGEWAFRIAKYFAIFLVCAGLYILHNNTVPNSTSESEISNKSMQPTPSALTD
jgi:hypothetical protein